MRAAIWIVLAGLTIWWLLPEEPKPLEIGEMKASPPPIVRQFKQSFDNEKEAEEVKRPMHEAVLAGDINQVRYLLNSGVSPNEVNSRGQSPLHLAVELGRVDLVRELLEQNADIYLIAEKKEVLPVFLSAVLYNYPEIVRALIEHDPAVIHTRDHQGRDAVVLALQFGHTILADDLRRWGVESEL